MGRDGDIILQLLLVDQYSITCSLSIVSVGGGVLYCSKTS